jgi:hypothetical protein
MGIRITIECDSEDEIRDAVREAAARIEREYRAGTGPNHGQWWPCWATEDGGIRDAGRYRIDLTPE